MEASIATTGPRVLANNWLGRHDTERFFPLDYDALLQRMAFFQSRNMLSEALQISKGDVVLEGLLRGVWHE